VVGCKVVLNKEVEDGCLEGGLKECGKPMVAPIGLTGGANRSRAWTSRLPASRKFMENAMNNSYQHPTRDKVAAAYEEGVTYTNMIIIIPTLE
jgi:hypothetical protein